VSQAGFDGDFDQTPPPDPSKAIEVRLRNAYQLLMRRQWTKRDPTGGKTFCKLTELGREQLADEAESDAAPTE
jgi:hypothetical protein